MTEALRDATEPSPTSAERDALLRQCEDLNARLGQLLSEQRASLQPPHLRAPQNSIFIATLPKSGTEFIWGGIRDATGLIGPSEKLDRETWTEYLSGYCNRPGIVSSGVYTSERLILAELCKLPPTGFVHASHCLANHHNLCTLRDAGLTRVTVLFRDPRDATVSWTYHLRVQGPQRRNFNLFLQHIPARYFDWPHAEQLAFQVRTFLPSAINWIESWLDAAATPENGLAIQLIAYDQLRTDPIGVFKRVFAFHEIDDYDLSKIKPAAPGTRHFRNGQSGSWRTEFSDGDQALAASLIGDRLKGAFDAAA